MFKEMGTLAPTLSTPKRRRQKIYRDYAEAK